MIPWTVVVRNKKQEGKELPEIEKEWTALIEAPNTEAVKRHGLWHVPDYQGFFRERKISNNQSMATARSATIESSAQLTDLEVGGQRILSQFRESMQKTPSGNADGAPSTGAQMSDQPVRSAPPNVISHQVHREALCGESGCGMRDQGEL